MRRAATKSEFRQAVFDKLVEDGEIEPSMVVHITASQKGETMIELRRMEVASTS